MKKYAGPKTRMNNEQIGLSEALSKLVILKELPIRQKFLVVYKYLLYNK